MMIVSFLISLSLLASNAYAWGAIGHEIVATIAQTQLHPAVRQYLCTILPVNGTSYNSNYPRDKGPQQHCHLAPFAGWPDRVRFLYPWSSHLHYVNPVDDEPPKHCTYGEHGWKDGGSGNVLEAIVNYTSQVSTSKGYERDIAMRFLVHYMGDAHQPLHLTGRARGGNDIAVRYEGRYAKLHSVWDSLLINSQIRQLANYSTRLPSARIESALRGRTYDAYIRWILVEGLGQGKRADDKSKGWWEDEAGLWTSCPTKGDNKREEMGGLSSAHWLRTMTPQSSKLAERIFSTQFRKAPVSHAITRPDDIDDTDLPVCPYAWTKPMHPLVCSYAFSSPIPGPEHDHHGPLAELDVPEYKGRIEADKVVQKQLALGGIRLAAVLNTVLLPEALMAQEGQVSSAFTQVDKSSTVTQDREKKHKKKDKRHGNSQSPIIGLVKVTAESIAEVILLSSVGYILARQGVLDKKTQTKINKLNVSFFTPSLLFSKVAFTLNPARLAELIIVPAGFVIITVISCAAAFLLSWTANLSRSQRNFSIACAITPNSNSLPVALMQSLVVTVPQLHWEEEGEPEDTANGMLGRSLTYLVLFSTLGMFLRWSVASKLLSTMDDTEVEAEPEVRTGRLIDHDDEQDSTDTSPRIVIRRSTEDGGGAEAAAPANLTGETLPAGSTGRRSSRTRQGPPAWARSFPNSPAFSDEDDEEEGEVLASQQRRGPSTSRKIWEKGVVKPFKAVTSFMTMPLYAATISLIVALIPPLQKAVASIEPLVGAIETAGACSIPLTMVVLGAYFYQEADLTTATPSDDATARPPTASTDATLVGNGDSPKHSSYSWMPNPWSRNSNSSKASSRNGSVSEEGGLAGTAEGSLAQRNTQINAGRSSCWPLRQDTTLSPVERKQQKQKRMERRTIAVAVASRMVLTPLVLIPFLAWWVYRTSDDVLDDPVFVCCAALLIGSPPALTLAQITSQSAKGNNSSFERLISKTIFVSYAILAAPTTIVLVLSALLITENDP